MTDINEKRFAFGENWCRFVALVDEERMAESASAIERLAGPVRGKSFLDIGCGSGLSSLAAVRLGASRVHSFDYDPDSVSCTLELKRRFSPDAHWTIEKGSALDADYLQSLGKYDVVYSWGVLHHTGDLWKALELAVIPLRAGGLLAVSLYNDQGPLSRVWARIKRVYNILPAFLRPPYVFAIMAPREFAMLVSKGPAWYIQSWRDYSKRRGMSRWHDIVDWIGGYPFQVSTPSQVFNFFHDRGYQLERLTTCGGRSGCNEYAFMAPCGSAPVGQNDASTVFSSGQSITFRDPTRPVDQSH
jgi:2-polyprenyl-3-methyl-5-hydroxy-6-metoxy-1,4-benzoquinol methylase